MNSVAILSDEEALPYLFRVIYSLSPKWHGLCLQLGVPDLDEIKKNGTGADDCLVLALQNWLKGGEATWRNLIRAIFLPAGGGNQVLAKKVASSFKGMYNRTSNKGHSRKTSL